MRNPLKAPTITQLFLKGADLEDDAFYHYVRLPNGTFKTTTTRRHADIDECLCSLLQGESRTYSILDIAASSGTSTVELSDCLKNSGVRHQMFGADLALYAKCVKVPPVTILCSEDNFLYQVDIGGLAFPNTPPSKLTAAVFFLATAILKLHGAFVRHPRTIKMLSRSAAASDVVFESGNIFGRLIDVAHPRSFDVIRASNILHRNYFSAEDILRAIRNLKSNLNEGGLLVINRTDHARNRCTMYRLREGELAAVAETNGGSDIADLVAESNG